MHITTTRNFSEWALEDEYLEDLKITRQSIKSQHTRSDIRSLRNIGMTSSSLGYLYGMMRCQSECGFATFKKMRFLCWYWENGDKIIFPINSKNTLYLGNDSEDWCKYWPFLSQIESEKYQCNLKQSDSPLSYIPGDYILAIGGQTHFGHFVANRIAALHQSNLAYPDIMAVSNILVPPHYTDLHWSILKDILGGGEKVFHELPARSGIHSVSNAVVPCIDEHPDAITGLQGVLEKRNLSRPVRSGKRTYITRAHDCLNDRIFQYTTFCHSLSELGFNIVNPMDLSYLERLSVIGESEFILTDPGSCALNGLLFGNQQSTIRCMIPKRVLESTDSCIINQLCLGFKQGVKSQWLPLHSHVKSISNPWYDILISPTPSLLKGLIANAETPQSARRS